MDRKEVEELVDRFLERYNQRGFSGVYELRDVILKSKMELSEKYIGGLVVEVIERNLGGKIVSERVYGLEEGFRERVLNDLRKIFSF